MLTNKILLIAIIIAIAGCKKEEPKSTTNNNESDKLKISVEQAELRIKTARLATLGQTTFLQWCAGVTRYKSVYGFYPNIGTNYLTSTDSVHKLETGLGINFVKCLFGKNASGAPLARTAGGDRAKFNRNAEEFCAFSTENFDATGNLVDVFGNTKIRVIFDTDGNGVIRNITEPDLPKEIAAAGTAEGIQARVIIYTKGENGIPDIVAVL